MKIGMINNISFKMNYNAQQVKNSQERKKGNGRGKGAYQLEIMKHPLPDPEKIYDADHKPGFSRISYDYSNVFENMNGERIIVLKEKTQNEKDDYNE